MYSAVAACSLRSIAFWMPKKDGPVTLRDIPTVETLSASQIPVLLPRKPDEPVTNQGEVMKLKTQLQKHRLELIDIKPKIIVI